MNENEEVKKPESLLDLFKYVAREGFDAFKNVMLNEVDKKDLLIYAGLSYLSWDVMKPVLNNDMAALLYGPVALKLALNTGGDNLTTKVAFFEQEIPFGSQAVGLAMLAVLGLANLDVFSTGKKNVAKAGALAKEVAVFKDKYWDCMLEEDRLALDEVENKIRSVLDVELWGTSVLEKAIEDFNTLKDKVEGYCLEDTHS